jgi:hypothetical protein
LTARIDSTAPVFAGTRVPSGRTPADVAKRYHEGHQHCPAEPYDRYDEPGRHYQAIGVAIRACRAGHRVLFATAPE